MYVKDWRYETDLVFTAAAGPVDDVASNGGSWKKPSRVRVEFPETWLWSDSLAGLDPSTLALCDGLLSAACSLYVLCILHAFYFDSFACFLNA